MGHWSVSSFGGGLVDAGRRRRALLELGLAVVSAGLAGLTLLSPEWIEGLFGVEPDRGSGIAEWGIVFALSLIAVFFGVLGRLDLRDAMQGQTQAGSR